MSKSIIIIPSRLSATRLPNKPLIKVNNKSLIMHVYEKSLKSEIGEVYVATCDEEIANEVSRNGGKYIMTNSSHTNGTERVYEASQKLNLNELDLIVNVQGDEPMINPADIKNLHNLSKEKDLNISTLAYNITNINDYKNQNIVKVVTKNKISIKRAVEALNFHRFIDFNNNSNIYHHFGIYLFKFSALKEFVSLQKSKNEIIENLEQLRAIDNNMIINVILANSFSCGIDTKEDLEEYIKLVNKQ